MDPARTSRRARVHSRSVLAAALVLGACTEEVEDPFIPIHETDRLRIGTSFADGLCRGERDMWEAHLDEVEQLLGVAREPTWLYLYRDDEKQQIAEDCGVDYPALLGCWQKPVVRAIRLAAPHELVHAWLDATQRRALPVLREGIALRMSGHMMFTDDFSFFPEEGGPLTLDDLVLEVPADRYDEAGHLVAWLLETHGAETFMALYTRTSRNMSSDELSAAFLEVLGQTTADALLAYQATAHDYYPAMGGSSCGRGPKIPWHDGAATWQTETSCADDPLFGLESADQWQRVTIEVPADGWYLLDPAGREASMTHCLTKPTDESDLQEGGWSWAVKDDWKQTAPMNDFYNPRIAQRTDAWAEHELELAAGTYDVWVQSYPDEIADISLFKLDL